MTAGIIGRARRSGTAVLVHRAGRKSGIGYSLAVVGTQSGLLICFELCSGRYPKLIVRAGCARERDGVAAVTVATFT